MFEKENLDGEEIEERDSRGNGGRGKGISFTKGQCHERETPPPRVNPFPCVLSFNICYCIIKLIQYLDNATNLVSFMSARDCKRVCRPYLIDTIPFSSFLPSRAGPPQGGSRRVNSIPVPPRIRLALRITPRLKVFFWDEGE